MTTPPPLQTTLDELKGLDAFFVRAEEAIKRGELVDMTSIDERVEAVCAIVQTAGPEHQKAFLPELTGLLSRLDSCELAIRCMQPLPQTSQGPGGTHADT